MTFSSCTFKLTFKPFFCLLADATIVHSAEWWLDLMSSLIPVLEHTNTWRSSMNVFHTVCTSLLHLSNTCKSDKNQKCLSISQVISRTTFRKIVNINLSVVMGTSPVRKRILGQGTFGKWEKMMDCNYLCFEKVFPHKPLKDSKMENHSCGTWCSSLCRTGPGPILTSRG